jgi:putative toxin-antitoxin system antitoxin component (TIGR02293 family)
MARVARPAKRKRRRDLPTGFGEDERPFLHDDIVRGVKAQRVKDLIERGVLDAKQVFRVIPMRTFNRRLANHEPLKTTEADAVGRLLRVTHAAEKTFGDAGFARRWLTLPNPVLNERVPIELAETDAGARQVEDVLLLFAHGDYA